MCSLICEVLLFATRASRQTARDDVRLLGLAQYIYHNASGRQIGFIMLIGRGCLVNWFAMQTLPGRCRAASYFRYSFSITRQTLYFPISWHLSKAGGSGFLYSGSEVVFGGCAGYMKAMMPALMLRNDLGSNATLSTPSPTSIRQHWLALRSAILCSHEPAHSQTYPSITRRLTRRSMT